jgi:hypothetical protein
VYTGFGIVLSLKLPVPLVIHIWLPVLDVPFKLTVLLFPHIPAGLIFNATGEFITLITT